MHQINYKMTVQYEGTRYKGWQKQPRTDLTIQGKLESVLERCLGEKTEVFGAGRTDAGVHALGQTASFRVTEEAVCAFADRFPAMQASWYRPPQSGTLLPSQQAERLDSALFSALNHYLPEDIAVSRLVRASDRFHARYLTSSKWYRYRIRTAPYSDVMNRRFLWQYGAELDTEAMQAACRDLVGTHDFTSYCGLKMKKSAVRTITRILISRPDEEEILLDFYGDGFLNHMVRLITGQLVEIGAGRADPSSAGEILQARQKGAANKTAPASGLTLMEVRY